MKTKMSEFNYKDGQLLVEEVRLLEIAEKFSTPCYIYSKNTIQKNFLAYKEAFDKDQNRNHQVCYSVKANSNLSVLKILAQLGSGFDIVSGGELQRVIRAGGNPSKIVFSGVAKTRVEINDAISAGVKCFNVESITELKRIDEVAKNINRVANISIRVNPDVDAETHPYISTGLKENKFGISIDEALDVYKFSQTLDHINIIGVDCHIGSQLTSLLPFIDALKRVISLIDQLEQIGIEIEHIDIGGGLGVSYKDETLPTPKDYIESLLKTLGSRKQNLIIEPGRSIIANAGALLTKIDTIKTNDKKNFAIVDAGMNDLLRPSLYNAWMDVIPVIENTSSSTNVYDIVGPVCETGDFIAKDRILSIKEEDLLCVCSAGAYGFVMSSNYNSRGRAAEVIVDGDKIHLARKRETIDDLLNGEIII